MSSVAVCVCVRVREALSSSVNRICECVRWLHSRDSNGVACNAHLASNNNEVNGKGKDA